ncbi:transporter substrate-binding domain-containing protein [Psychromarinibacter sp. C21-152]|uniref:Transporter substrate-binding domain-containing protein n=1 Tax=Psychromarinibacter sediminicola TaxID=3033385 RepID=A0AAE3NRQ9_9RHOB|nr:transporter substrate-binding domain-containing protein [Psychromarinibacter sediminicola]MDF0601264.1 transporter substrate-binding domain-containing protein [Psychromarinibacter sediminicola]
MLNTINKMGALAIGALIAGTWQTAAVAEPDADLVAKLPEQIVESGVIKVGAPRTIPPHVYLEDNELTGVAVELAHAMEPILGVTFDFRDMQWPGIIPGLQSGAIDLSMGMISFREERKEILNMMPYIKDAISVLVPVDNTDITSDDTTLCGKRVGAVQASWFVELANGAADRCEEAGLEKLTIQQYSGNAGVLAAFQSGAVDAWLHTAVELTAIIVALDGQAKLVNMEGDNWKTGNLTIATGKAHSDLAEAIDGALDQLVENGTYQEILDKYDVGALALESIEINP